MSMTGLHVFGVRHLSPGGAWHLRALLDSVRPKVVLIEGLADADELVHHITKKGTKPPVAILAYTDSVPVRTLVYPLAAYSPEFQAMLWAKENNARVEFIDLPSDIFLGLQDVEIERMAKRAEAKPGETPAPDANAWRPEHGGSLYDRIAERCGEADYDAYWERRYEHNLNHDSYRLAAHELGRELRAEPDEPVWRAENLVREAFMRRRIKEVLADGVKANQVVAVVGAFHAPVLTDDHPAMTDAELASLRRRSSKLTLMPYSYFKLSSQSGYGAGNRAPAYFDLFWEMLNTGGLEDLPLRYLSEVVRKLRGAGTHRSTAEVIEGVRLARTLAAMHDGSAPTLGDLHDAAVTLVGGGEVSTIAEALSHVDVGTAIGELPKGVTRTSIQEDFDRQMARLKLEKFKKTVAEELTLDLRENRHVKTTEAAFLDLNRSSFLHRLRVLEIGFAKPLARNNQQTTWAEAWKLQWSPEHEISLVEAVLLGETVELATAYKFKQRLDAATGIAEAADVVKDACLCGLSASMDLARKRLQELAAVSSDLAAIAHAATALSQVVRYGDVRKFDPAPLLPLIDELFVQGALALFPAANCDNAAAGQLADAIEELNRISLEHHERVEGELWVTQLRKLSDADDRNPLLSGFACAVLLERGLIATEDLAREVSRRLSPGIPADLGAGWFEGLSKRNRAALLARQPLWIELAGYVQSLDDDQLKRAIVFLRRAFGGFSPQQKRQICENLAELWGVNADDAKEALDTPLTEAEQQKLTDLNEFSFDDI
ncbi:hypothetical protein PX52LOC_07224 [Limnoglobus roseus]|uniref:Uncharacterized protein n=2 Tax=Limnoglobus roseus TaxID=2598579 RepID=A0A5C1AQ37_9BACT|nr:hypothetical protein PX52LOC_07224 [Limnoglobus roseus]